MAVTLKCECCGIALVTQNNVVGMVTVRPWEAVYGVAVCMKCKGYMMQAREQLVAESAPTAERAKTKKRKATVETKLHTDDAIRAMHELDQYECEIDGLLDVLRDARASRRQKKKAGLMLQARVNRYKELTQLRDSLCTP